MFQIDLHGVFVTDKHFAVCVGMQIISDQLLLQLVWFFSVCPLAEQKLCRDVVCIDTVFIPVYGIPVVWHDIISIRNVFIIILQKFAVVNIICTEMRHRTMKMSHCYIDKKGGIWYDVTVRILALAYGKSTEHTNNIEKRSLKL